MFSHITQIFAKLIPFDMICFHFACTKLFACFVLQMCSSLINMSIILSPSNLVTNIHVCWSFLSLVAKNWWKGGLASSFSNIITCDDALSQELLTLITNITTESFYLKIKAKKVSRYSINLKCFDSKHWSNRKCNQSWYFLLQSFWMFIKCAAAIATAQPLMSSWHGKAVDQTGSKRFDCGLMAVNSAFIPNFIVGQKVVTLMSLECTSLRGFLTNMKATQDPTLSWCLFDFLFGCPYYKSKRF